MHSKVSKGAKIRNGYNQVPHLTQVAIVLRSIQYLRLTVYAFGRNDEKDEKKILLGPLASTLLFFYVAGSSTSG